MVEVFFAAGFFSLTSVITADAFTKLGYTFVGWSTTPTGRVEYENGQLVSKLTTVDEAVIDLYAVWQANTYTIKFDANTGNGTMSDLVMTYDQEKALTIKFS